jgi:tyrosine-protein kinase Etk/Wzc
VKAVDPMVRQKIYALLSKQVETALMAEVKGNIFKIIDPPKVPDKKIRPKRALMLILAMIMSMFVGVFLAFFLEYLEKMKAVNAQGIETEKGDKV